MKKLFLSILVCIASLQLAWAQYSVSGKVTDTQNNPLIGAAVLLNSQGMGTVTDVNGNFIINNLKADNYELHVSYLGYKQKKRQLVVERDVKLQIVLIEKSVLTGEVVVTSIKAGNKTPVAKTNVSREELKALNAADDIPLLLSMTPSVVSSTESGIGVGNSSFRIRGTDATRINITVNGIPLNDSESQGVYWVNMPDFSSSVGEVQVQRGVGTSTNGGAAFGASINFNTTGYHAEPFTEISSTAGSFNTFKNSINASTGLLMDKYSFDVRYSDLQSDGYVDYAFSDHQSLYMSATMHLENSFIKANIIHGDQRTGISWWGIDKDMLKTDRTYNPAGQYTDEYGNERYYEDQTDNYIQTHYQLFYSQNIGSKWLANTALHYTDGEGFYEQYKEDEEFEAYGWQPEIRQSGDTITSSDMIRQKWLASDFYGFTASLNYHDENLQMNFGGGWNKHDGDHYGKVIWARYGGTSEKEDEWYRNKGVKRDYNVYAKVNYQISPKLNVFGDLQYRGIEYTMSGLDDDLTDRNLARLDQHHQYDFFNPKAGVFYSLNRNHQMYASYAVANREAARADFKEARGDAKATPQPERLNDVEVGYHYKSAKLAANINFYYMFYKDQLIPTGEKSSVGYTIMTNVEDSYRTGVELNLGVQILPRLRWDGNATFSKNIVKDFVHTFDPDGNHETNNNVLTYYGDTQIAYSPGVIANSTFNFDALSNTNIKLITKHVGEQYYDNTETASRKLSDYTVFNAIATQAFYPGWMKKVELQLSVNNLFNTQYVSNAYGGSYAYNGEEIFWAAYFPQAGTHAFLRVRLLF
ncbi:iron complex outermembrane recepter protein [Saccharicrinis carchari]|uniref:Iron complex outermembrane recepter protein n=1 Tax=Saccharicrinis carchari TaxID=1168039 RepID=A0A521EAI4_SACCC|nr:TonB-dependent receptor [Saccharicrinis carchari]SMO80945.1 iron complex outermembrane recepter protein [Saccharicrinis carchari]